MDNGFQNIFHIQSGLCGYARRVMRFNTDNILDLIRNPVRSCAWQVDLVDDREHIQVMIQRQIHIRQSLGFNALGCVYHKNSAVTGCQASGYLVVKVHMSRGVDQVKNILFSIFRVVDGADRLRLDGNAALPLQIHIIQYLGLHLTAGQKTGHLNDAVGQGRFAVVNVGDDTEVADLALVH